MDRKIFPLTRKIPIDRISIPFFWNDPQFKILDFIKKLYKYRIILEKARKVYCDVESKRFILVTKHFIGRCMIDKCKRSSKLTIQ